MFKKIFLGMLVCVATPVLAKSLPDGVWRQTWSSAGNCATCKITIKRETPHIIKIVANNHWVGYASYHPDKDAYLGEMEWKKGAGGAYENQVLNISLKYDGKTLKKRASGLKGNYDAAYALEP